jgi:signal transduction histidine kinase
MRLAIQILVNMTCLLVFCRMMAQIGQLRFRVWQCALLLLPAVPAAFYLKGQALNDLNPATVTVGLAALFILLAFAFWIYRGPLPERIIIFLFLAAGLTITVSDVSLGNIMFSLWERSAEIPDLAAKVMYGVLLWGLLTAILIGLFGWLVPLFGLWKCTWMCLIYPFVPIGQWIVVSALYYQSFNHGLVFVGIALCLLSNLVFFFLITEQEGKIETSETLSETRRRMELEQAHYQEVERRREELAKIRHDFNNHLAAIDHLIRSGEGGSAQGMIRDLAAQIVATKENTYCAIPIINAVLREKAQTCAAAGIGLEVELNFPQRFDAEPTHLCSLFSNLLDNAISACRQTKDSEAATIRLTAMTDGDYLFVKTVNPSAAPVKDFAPGRGYGSRILSEVAAKHGGGYQSEYKEGVFTAMVSLLVEKEIR